MVKKETKKVHQRFEKELRSTNVNAEFSFEHFSTFLHFIVSSQIVFTDNLQYLRKEKKRRFFIFLYYYRYAISKNIVKSNYGV